ncbi:MAG: 23S rRNA (adenine(2503)-C(2))-methyltransferase RlmN [Nitrospinales bacterium]
MINLIGHPEEKLKEKFLEWGVKPYRANQIFTWIYHKGARSLDQMTNISKDFRKTLGENYYIKLPQVERRVPSKDGSIKYLFRLEDDEVVESVWMPNEGRRTLCISTQVGCRLACSFCNTATLGLQRNLTSAEIVGQIMTVKDEYAKNSHDPENENGVTNVVIMGMGEPLDNYDPVVDSVRIMISPEAMKISTRKVTLSTSGLVDKIKKFQTENLHVNLAISLNASEDETRSKIMPINKKYPIKVLMDALRQYPLKPSRRLTFEYVLLGGINDTLEDAVRVAKLLEGIPSKVNLIPFNPFDDSGYKEPDRNKVLEFQNYLLSQNITVFIRVNRGADILGACGQLAGQHTSGPTLLP